MRTALVAATVGLLVPAACVTAAPAPQDCTSAIGLAFIDLPVSVRTRMQHIAWRESRNTPTARNAHSSATGCLQLLKMHEPIARRLGYTWAQMREAWPNARVGRVLYDACGFTPWRLTA